MARRPIRHRVLVVLAAVVAAVTVPTAAQAAVPRPTGIDVSYPNCGAALPAADFVVVGVNDGRGRTDNPCLAAELAFAALSPGTVHPAIDVYVNTQNPTPSSAAWWPSGDRTLDGHRVRSPYGHCSGGRSTACSWVYGAAVARDDRARLAATGFTGPVGRWWLDVETANSWSGSTARNRAALEGMASALTDAKQRVGVYALVGEFADLIGTVPASSRLAKLPSWIAGAADRAHAERICTRTPLARGRVTLVQWKDVATNVDHDVACATFTSAPRPTVSGHAGVGSTLTARPGTWGPGSVRLSYRWTRDGHPIAKAVHRTYRLTKADARHRVAVTVTATGTGYSRSVRRSGSHRITP